MRNTKTGFKLLLEYMVLNIKFIQQEYFPAVFTITTFLVPCVTWTQEPLRWWFQVQTCVPRVGRASTKDTWWLNTIVITVQCTLVLMRILITSQELMPIVMVHCFILSKENVVPFLVNLMSTAVNWHAQCALVNPWTFLSFMMLSSLNVTLCHFNVCFKLSMSSFLDHTKLNLSLCQSTYYIRNKVCPNILYHAKSVHLISLIYICSEGTTVTRYVLIKFYFIKKLSSVC